MRRFECTEGSASKFWEVAVEGKSLTTRWGRIGTQGQMKSKELASEAAAQHEMDKLIRSKLTECYVEIGVESGTAVSKAPPKAKPEAIPPFPGVEPRAVKSLVTKLGKAKDSYKIQRLLQEASSDDPFGLAWYLVTHDLLPTAHHDPFLVALAELDPSFDCARDGELMARLVARRATGTGPQVQTSWFPGWLVSLDPLVFRALPWAPDAFDALTGDAKLGVDFVRMRLGLPVDAACVEAVLDALARGENEGYGISGNGDLLVKGKDGTEEKQPVAEFVTRLGDWGAALARAIKRAPAAWGLIEHVRPGLERLSLAELSEVLAARPLYGLFSDSSNATETMLAIMRARKDPPDALLAVPHPQCEDEGNASKVRELYATIAAERLIAEKRSIPEAFDEAFARFKLMSDAYATRSMIEVLRHVPRERVLRLVKAALPDAWEKAAPLAALGAHFDAEIFDGELAAGRHLSEELLGAIGAEAVLPLAHSARSVEDPAIRENRYRAMLLAMQEAVRTGMSPPEKWDPLLVPGELDGKPIERWRAGDSALGKVLGALPAPRRAAILKKASPEAAQPYATLASDDAVEDMVKDALVQRKMTRDLLVQLGEKAIPALVQHIDACKGDIEVLETLERTLSRGDYEKVTAAMTIAKESPEQAMARFLEAARAAGKGDTMRVYLAEPASSSRPGSMSCVGGRAPGLSDDAIPLGADDEPLSHIMTIDLEEVRELRSKFPGARAVSIFVADPETGGQELEDDVKLVPLTVGAPLDPESTPLDLIGIDAPVEIFADGERPRAIDDLRRQVGKASAHILGRPFWIQEFDGDDDGLLVQINDGLVPGLNLGDVGSLYVFDTGDAVFHCH